MFKTNQSFKYDYKFIIRKKIYKQVGKLIFIIIFLSYLFERGNETPIKPTLPKQTSREHSEIFPTQ